MNQVLKRDGAEAKDKAPKVMQEGMGNPVKGSRSYSTTARRQVELQLNPQPTDDMAINYPTTESASWSQPSTKLEDSGHIYELPSLPFPRNMHLKRREDPLVEQFTKLILKSGRLSRAQRV